MGLESSFTDVKGHWALREIVLLWARGILRGTGDRRFQPQTPATRAQFTALLLRALNLEEYSGSERSFNDLPVGHWAFGAVEAAYRAGLVRGTGAGRFEPERAITRQEMAVLVARALEAAGAGLSVTRADEIFTGYTDAAAMAAWARSGMELCLGLGIIRSRGERRLAPLEEATRAESAVILRRMMTELGLK